ncbi:MAG: phosphatidylglycerophosphatase A [Bacteroidota bacterium]|nr:phosphatidylglycerophosphatase A [Bacteroidota bacterium]
MILHKVISTSLGIGYIKNGGGTVAALFTCICWYLAPFGGNETVLLQIATTLLITFFGVWSASKVEPIWGKDDKKVVIDEVAGMCISLIWVPVTLLNLLAAFILFRIYDIAKPFFIRKAEKIPGGWGVMLDDVLAGIFANVTLQIFLLISFQV